MTTIYTDQAHGCACAIRHAPAAECTCGKADAEIKEDGMTNIYADALAFVIARKLTEGDNAKLVEPVEVVDEREATFTIQSPDNRSFLISVMDVTE
jgi:hypothetical protein